MYTHVRMYREMRELCLSIRLNRLVNSVDVNYL